MLSNYTFFVHKLKIAFLQFYNTLKLMYVLIWVLIRIVFQKQNDKKLSFEEASLSLFHKQQFVDNNLYIN